MKKIILVCVIVILTYFNSSTSRAVAPDRTLQDYSVKELVAHFAEKYGNSASKVEKVMNCESGGNPKAWNKTDPNGGSKGIMQFQESTFYDYAARINIVNPDIWNREQQIEVASYMFRQGLAYHWSCARITGVVK